MAFRGLFGSGLRISLLQKNKSRLWWGSSLMYEYERLDIEESDEIAHKKVANVFRWSNYVSAAFLFKEDVNFSLTSYFQPQIDELEDIRILLETNFSVQLSEKLSLAISYRLRYDSRPPGNVKNTDTNFLTGLNYQF